MKIKKFNLNKISKQFKGTLKPRDIEIINNFVIRITKFDENIIGIGMKTRMKFLLFLRVK